MGHGTEHNHFKYGVSAVSDIAPIYFTPKDVLISPATAKEIESLIKNIDSSDQLKIIAHNDKDLAREKLSPILSLLGPVRDYINAQEPMLFEKLLQHDPKIIFSVISELTKDSAPSATKTNHPEHICLIIDSVTETNHLENTFNLSGTFRSEHLKPFEMPPSIQHEFVGRHEGEHCNQHQTLASTIERFRNEALADITAINGLSVNNANIIKQRVIDMRAIHAAIGDADHASSIFIANPALVNNDLEPAYAAANSFKKDISQAVANKLDITRADALELFKNDPRKFTNTLKDLINNGAFPATMEQKSVFEIQQVIATNMGLDSVRELYQIKMSDLGRFVETYKQLRDKGEFDKEVAPNPYTLLYAQQLVDAADRIFVRETTPINETSASVNIEDNATAKYLNTDELKVEAKNLVSGYMHMAVADQLNIPVYNAIDLKEKDKGAYYKALQSAIDAGEFNTEVKRPMNNNQSTQVIVNYLGMKEAELKLAFDKDPLLFLIVNNTLLNNELFYVKQDNPYILQEAKEQLINSGTVIKPQNEMKDSLLSKFNNVATGGAATNNLDMQQTPIVTAHRAEVIIGDVSMRM